MNMSSIPSVRGARLPLFTVSAVFFIALFWFFRPAEQAEPVPEWQWLTQQWLTPVAQQKLTAGQLREAGGALWLEAQSGQLRLVYRVEFEHEQSQWRAQAQIAVPADQLQALQAEQAWGLGEHSLSIEQSRAFAEQLVEQLWLASEPRWSAAQWLASAGQPRLKLQMDNGQAWVYPPEGLTAHIEQDQVTLLHQVSAQAMRGQRR